ncbi:MAG: 5-methyltetrahydrofolate--homocysteine methyltransferase [Eubacterium sp.]
MIPIYNIPIRLEKSLIFKQMHIYSELPNYAEFDKAYDELIDEIKLLAESKGIYVLKENTGKPKMHKGLCEVSHQVYVLVTLGEKISDRSTRYFKEKDFLKGLMIDAMADQILFNISDDFYKIIRKDIFETRGYALTVRYSPDDHFIPIENQKVILDEVHGKELLGIDVTEGFMYRPLKTMGYVYGADKNITIAEKDHDCRLCSNEKCEFRTV